MAAKETEDAVASTETRVMAAKETGDLVASTETGWWPAEVWCRSRGCHVVGWARALDGCVHEVVFELDGQVCRKQLLEAPKGSGSKPIVVSLQSHGRGGVAREEQSDRTFEAGRAFNGEISDIEYHTASEGVAASDVELLPQQQEVILCRPDPQMQELILNDVMYFLDCIVVSITIIRRIKLCRCKTLPGWTDDHHDALEGMSAALDDVAQRLHEWGMQDLHGQAQPLNFCEIQQVWNNLYIVFDHVHRHHNQRMKQANASMVILQEFLESASKFNMLTPDQIETLEPFAA